MWEFEIMVSVRVVRISELILKIPGERHHARALFIHCMKMLDASFAAAAVLNRHHDRHLPIGQVFADLTAAAGESDKIAVFRYFIEKYLRDRLLLLPGVHEKSLLRLASSLFRIVAAAVMKRFTEINVDSEVLAQTVSVFHAEKINHMIVLTKRILIAAKP